MNIVSSTQALVSYWSSQQPQVITALQALLSDSSNPLAFAPFFTADRIVPPTLLASRSFLGYGQERGMIELKIRNNELGRERTVLYVEQLPWFVKPLLHTMTTEVKEDEFGE